LNGGPVEAWLFPEGKQEGLAGMVSGAFPRRGYRSAEAVRDPKARRMFLSPRWGLLCSDLNPTAYAVGSNLPALRGWCVARFLLNETDVVTAGAVAGVSGGRLLGDGLASVSDSYLQGFSSPNYEDYFGDLFAVTWRVYRAGRANLVSPG